MSESKVIIFGCKSTTAFLIQEFMKESLVDYVVTISPASAAKAEVADYFDLRKLCAFLEIPCYVANKYSLKNDDDKREIAKLNPSIGFVIGWQRLIPADILNLFSVGIFGMHGSADDLPLGRGRSPMNWALIERRKFFQTNLFRYDEGIDSGDILDSFVFSIQDSDTAETMHFKNLLAMKMLILKNIDNLRKGKLILKPQRSDIEPTFYPKRNPEDSIIDWNQDIFSIEAHIRAVSKPFSGAFTFYENDKIFIYRAAIFETDLVDYGYKYCKYGEILEIFPNNKFLVRCRGGILLVHEYEAKAQLKKNNVLYSPQELIKKFHKNDYGYHDLKIE